MRRVATSRRTTHDLLARPPWGGAMYDDGWTAMIVDPTAQLTALAELLRRGLLTREEFEHQKAKVLAP